jgi:hypothetical protein
MNYRDLQNISQLSQQILTESTTDNDVMGRWPYSSPYLQEERAPGVKPYRGTATQAEVRADAKKARQKQVEKAKDQEGYGPDEKFKDWKDRATPGSTLKRKKKEGGTEDETVSQRMDREHPYKKRMTGPLARKQGSRIASAVTRTIEGPGEPQAVTMPRMGRDEKPKLSREVIRKEDFDLYDLILHHLMTEGFAETAEAATAIMTNMSEAWVDSIVDYYIEG